MATTLWNTFITKLSLTTQQRLLYVCCKKEIYIYSEPGYKEVPRSVLFLRYSMFSLYPENFIRQKLGTSKKEHRYIQVLLYQPCKYPLYHLILIQKGAILRNRRACPSKNLIYYFVLPLIQQWILISFHNPKRAASNYSLIDLL